MADDLSDIQSNILSYIPNSFLVKHLRSDAINETIPSANHSRALLLSTNIQNFSHITQHYLKESSNGLEIITNIHKQFIELVQEHLERTGADMLRHGTDTPLFYWEIPTSETEKTLDGLANIIIFELQQLKQVLRDKFSNQEILINFGFILTEGTLTTFTLGDSQQITDYVYGGPSLYEALECPRYPAEESLILVSQGVMQRIQNDFQVSSIDIIQEDGKHEPTNFFLVNRPLETCRAGELVLQAVDLRKMVRQDHFQSVRDEIRYFIPKCIESYIMNGIEPWGSEIRRVSVAFFCIPLDIQNLHYQEELIKLHETLRIVQANVQNYGGTVYRTYLDDKGANIYIVFGLYPESHADDSVRCILAAHSINTAVGRLGLPIFAGISTGEVLLSICGTYQKDLFLIGESLYTAFMLSLRSLNDGSKRIIVDDETKIAAEVKISFHLYKNPVFTGKVAEGIYHEVIYTGTPLPPIHPNPFPELRTHHYNMDYSGSNTMEDKLSSLFMVGRDTEFQSAKQIFLQFLKNPSKPNMLLLVGPYGIGKTLFAKNLMEMINDTAEKMNAFGNRPVVLTSSVNPSSRIGKLNGWRFIMREILDRIALSYGQQKEELLYELLEIEPDLQANIPLLKDILDLDVKLEQEEQVLYTEENHAEVPDYEQRIINKILIVILKRFLGEKVTFGSPEVSGNRNTRDSSNKEGSASLIICLDDIQEHDEMSWNLLSEISRKLQKVFLIGVLRDDEISTRCRNNIEEGMQNLASNPNLVLNKITLDPLKQSDLSNIGKRILGERELSDDLKKFITSKCEGNPLAVINLLETLLKQNMMQAVTGVIFPTESLQRLIKLGELIEIKVPLIRHKLNSVVLDKLSFIQYNVLKVACVIGDTFDMKALVVSNPFHTSLLTYSNLVLSLQELRRIGILDLADKSTKNTAYRFAVPFLRETMYQRIAPFLKRKQHRAVALCCEDQTEGQQRKEERIAYHWKLSEQDSGFRRGKNDNARRVFLLKQINAITSQPVKRGDLILKVGEIDKKSFKTFNKWSSRFMALTQGALKYYHNEREFNEKPVFQTGLIPLKHISTITPVALEGINTRPDPAEKPGFKIVAAKWEKGSQEIGRREFQFGCHNNDDAEDWQLCIEYMRNKAVYEDFMQNSDSTVLVKTVSKKGNNNTSSNMKGDISSRDKQQNIKIWMNASGQEEDYESREGYLPESSPFNRRPKREGTTTSRNTSPVIGRTDGREGMNIAKRQKNKEVLKTFLNKGQIVLWSYLCNAPFKTSLKGKGFGKNPALLLTKPELMRIDPDLVRPEPNLDVSISRRDNSSPKLPYGLDKAITEKLTTYDKARIDVKPNPQTKTGFSALPPSFWAQKTYSGLDDTVDDSSRSIVLGEKVLEDLSYSKRSITPERKKGSALPGMTYKDENCSVMVEEVTKSQQLLQAKPKIVDMSLLSRREGKSSLTTQVSFGIKGRRDLSKPNIYGRYEFVPTFFVDSYMDDKVVASKNNMVKRVESKVRKVTKRNIPNNASMVLNRKYEDGEEVYIMHEESHERIKNHHQRKTIQASRLEDEAPVYRSPSKIVQDFTHEEYSMSAGNRSFVDERVDHILDKIGGGGYTGETVKQSHNIYTNAGSLYSGHDFGLQKSSMGHVRYKSDISGVQMYPSDNSKSFDLKDSARLTPVKSGMDDLSGFVMNRPGKAEEERRSAYLGASPISQNQSILSDTGFRQTPNILSMSARKDQPDMYSRPANLYSEFQTRGDTSYREITRTPPRGFAKEENLNDSRLSDMKIYNANTSTAAGESPLDRIRPTPTPTLTPVEHLLKTYPVLNQDIPQRMSSNIGEDLGISPMKDFSIINRPIPQSTNLPYADSATIRYNKPEEPQFRAPVSNSYSVPLESVALTQSQPVFKPPFSMQTPNQGLSNSIRFNSGQSSVSFASPNMDPRLQKISPASNERTSITVNPPKGNINPTEFFCMGYIRHETVSQDGDYFSLAPRECVVVTRVYEKRALVEILWNGLSGLFPLSDVELVPPGDPREIERQIVMGTYEEAANRSQNYFVGYNQTGREEVKNTRNVSPIMYRDMDIDMSAPRFGSSVDYGAQSPSTPLSGSKMPSKMMMRQMKKMQDSRSSQLHEDSGFMKMGSNI